jgi:hypothetical protein
MECVVVKSYSGAVDHDSGNIDLLVRGSLLEVYERVFADGFTVTLRDRIKHRLYERNKLMLSPVDDSLVQLHLHSNVGWHDVCFISAEEVYTASIEIEMSGGAIRIPQRDVEARAFLLHVIFEKFKKNEQDQQLLNAKDFASFAEEFDLPEHVIAPVRDAGVGPLSLDELRPIWSAYYRARGRETPITQWNRFLHWGYTVKWRYDRLRAKVREMFQTNSAA